MNSITSTNQRLTTVLLVLLIVFVGLLIVGSISGPFLMGGGIMSGMMGMNGQMMSGMMSVYSEMMQNLQAH